MPAGRGLDTMVQGLWEQARPVALERVDVLDDAVAAVMVGALDEDLRARAQRESHKLAGSLGTRPRAAAHDAHAGAGGVDVRPLRRPAGPAHAARLRHARE